MHDSQLTHLKFLYLTEAFDHRAKLLQKTGRLGTFPSSRGQEIFFLACAVALNNTDWYCPYYRDHAALLYRGYPAHALFQYWAGDERGNIPLPPHTLPINVPIGSQTSHATGVAMALAKTSNICLVTLGDGASSKGEVYESINFAAIHSLPILFAVNNNQYAISTPLNLQTANLSIAEKFSNMGLETQSFNQPNHPEQIFSFIGNAAKQVRKNRAPLLIEVFSPRLDSHTTNDDASLYRTEQELSDEEKLCPIRLYEQHLLEKLFPKRARSNKKKR